MLNRSLRTKADIKTMVSSGKTVSFVRYHAKQLWYATECGFEFPVPLEDVGDTPYVAQDKAMLFLRFIRKHVDLIEQSMSKENGAPPKVVA